MSVNISDLVNEFRKAAEAQGSEGAVKFLIVGEIEYGRNASLKETLEDIADLVRKAQEHGEATGQMLINGKIVDVED